MLLFIRLVCPPKSNKPACSILIRQETYGFQLWVEGHQHVEAAPLSPAGRHRWFWRGYEENSGDGFELRLFSHTFLDFNPVETLTVSPGPFCCSFKELLTACFCRVPDRLFCSGWKKFGDIKEVWKCGLFPTETVWGQASSQTGSFWCVSRCS